MTVNEILLIIVVLGILIAIPSMAKHIKRPIASYIRFTGGLFLLVFAWFYSDSDRLLPKLVLTGIAVFGMIQSIRDYVRSVREPNL
jgi:hypothetical protein